VAHIALPCVSGSACLSLSLAVSVCVYVCLSVLSLALCISLCARPLTRPHPPAPLPPPPPALRQGVQAAGIKNVMIIALDQKLCDWLDAKGVAYYKKVLPCYPLLPTTTRYYPLLPVTTFPHYPTTPSAS
jgi:hypothetical protein